MNWVRPFWIALAFLTRLPAPEITPANERESGASLVAYPFVGAVIGLLLVLVALLTMFLPTPLQALLIVIAWVLITGALHLDGLADSADAWVGGIGSRTQTLALMKDPTCGPAGVTALILLLLLKCAAVLALLEAGAWLLLLLAPVVARAGLTALLLTTPYVRPGGLGEVLSLYAPPLPTLSSAALLSGAVAVLTGWAGIVALLVALLTLVIAQHAMVRRIGGTTGDTAGASVELIEATALLSAVAFIAATQ
ncbi:adenosylcobinamide-GDP ribazoletransferase [Halorhodospira abdelmalekii]|uniref:adenosylcobinamide-GDP ribazoletransferase n=1 Tax=Halorhodospira abdelmalekii TaxID=421629 RepID=UPI00190310CF|nr:adenosylcobinamide-GDP ribazoletransferase [Halorhodospira abdelmalekii]